MATKHSVSNSDPTYVTGADQYRISLTAIVPPDHRALSAMEQFFRPEHRRLDGYGVAFLESEEHSLTYIGSIQQIDAYRAANARTPGPALDVSFGHIYEFWPDGPGWDDVSPPTTWNPDGRGVVTELEHENTKVVVFEYLEDRAGGQVPVVAFHCLRCHDDRRGRDKVENRGPRDRRWMAREARIHIQQAAARCQPIDPHLVKAAGDVLRTTRDSGTVLPSWDTLCAASGACAKLRHSRVAMCPPSAMRRR